MYWSNEHSVTAVEYNEYIAAAYKDMYPNDNVVVADAHQYLLDHYKEFDFIWASPPCQTHSRARAMAIWGGQNNEIKYPDLSLYQEIIFLKHFAKGDWIVENVIPYYDPLIQPTFKYGRHLYWSNKKLLLPKKEAKAIVTTKFDDMCKENNIDISKYTFKGLDKRQLVRNMVEPEDGKLIFETMLGIQEQKQGELL